MTGLTVSLCHSSLLQEQTHTQKMGKYKPLYIWAERILKRNELVAFTVAFF